jgi:LmbE family N-acetylglucosaminyl deacetylase
MKDKDMKLEKYLFLGAHPDDIELGAGASLAKAIENGISCHSVIFADFRNLLSDKKADSEVWEESISAQLILGMSKSDITFHSFPVRRFDEFRQEILQILIDISQENHYSHIFIPNTLDIHQDHKVVSNEAIRAFKFNSLLGYELPWNNIESKINYYNKLEKSHLELKIRSLGEFSSQKERFYFSKTTISSIAKFRGLQIGVENAEGFEVIRYVTS